MEARYSHSSASLPPFQQEPSDSSQSPSQSSQASTNGPSGTGVSGQSVTTLTEHEPNQFLAAFVQQLVITLSFFEGDTVLLVSTDQQDLIYAGSWATLDAPPRTSVIVNDPILSATCRAGTAVDSASRGIAAPVIGNTEAVGLLRASLHREV